jgi:hypothetical protein
MKSLFLTSDLPISLKKTIKHRVSAFDDYQIVHANERLLQRSNPFDVALHIARCSYELIITKNLSLCEKVEDLGLFVKIIIVPGNASGLTSADFFCERSLQIKNFIIDDPTKLFLNTTKKISAAN